MTRRTLLILALLLACITNARAAAPRELWVYAPCNFQVDASVDKLIALLKRAKSAGYSAAVITDFKFGRIDDRPANYYTNLTRTRDAARNLGIELIPCVMPIGYSASILINNPNLAEGIPVRDCDFVVHDGKATVADRANLLPGGNFEKPGKNAPAGWDWIDGFGVSTSLDTSVKHAGASSLKMTNFGKGNESGNCRVVKKLALKPWHQYHLSVWIKTQNVSNPGEIHAMILADNRALNFANLGVKATQDWTKHDIVFNSLDHAEANLYLGLWDGGKDPGTIWLDEASCTLAGAINLVRRDGCPVRVTNADGSVVYEEGRDFEKWVNEKTGNDPYPGSFHVMTPEPPMVMSASGRIHDGDHLKVSYFHTVTIYDEQVSSCLVAPELFQHMQRQIELVHKYLSPKRYFMEHDELRVAGWCDLCTADHKTAGQLLAENVRHCTQIIKSVDPDAGIIVWSDMFDPNHNAVDKYYLVSSTLAGSWEGLDPSVMIANWNGGKAAKSLAFFANRGHHQVIAGYYDDGNVEASAKRWLDAAGPIANVDAIMYTTWRNDYANLERFAKAVAP
ncbi:MAG: hypothetical protein GC162_10510 [Planctomycetes bacterium]|nr:hypothetical protein [Planctomycetota bacterium]